MKPLAIVGIIGVAIVSWFIGFGMGVFTPESENIESINEGEAPEVIIREVEVPVEVIREVMVPAQPRPNDLIVQGVSVNNRIQDWFGLVGEVYNNGSVIYSSVRVTAMFYGPNQEVLCSNYRAPDFDDIDPGDTSPFEVFCSDEVAAPFVVSWKIAVEGNPRG